MDIQTIIHNIDLEIERLQSAKSLLTHTGSIAKKAGRPAKQVTSITAVSPKGKRVLSPEARKRIADAQKARWKKFKAARKAA
jgi:hypothetical protein